MLKLKHKTTLGIVAQVRVWFRKRWTPTIIISSSHSDQFNNHTLDLFCWGPGSKRSKTLNLTFWPFCFNCFPPAATFHCKISSTHKAAGPGEITLCWLVSNLSRSPGDETYSKKVAEEGKKVTKVTTVTALQQKSHQLYSGQRSDLLSDLWRFVERVKVKDALRRSVMCRLVGQHLGFCSRFLFSTSDRLWQQWNCTWFPRLFSY